MKCKYIKRDAVSRMLHIGSLLFLNLFQAFSDLFFAVPIYRLRPSFLWEKLQHFLTIWFTVLLNTLSPVDSYLNYSTACSKTADGFSSVHSRINMLPIERTWIVSLSMFLKDGIRFFLYCLTHLYALRVWTTSCFAAAEALWHFSNDNLKKSILSWPAGERLITLGRCCSHSNFGADLYVIFYLHCLCLTVSFLKQFR